MENPFELLMQKLRDIEALLKSGYPAPANAPATPAPVTILNTDQAASFLGLSKSTLYKLTAQRGIPHYKNGKKIYFRREELEQWLTRHSVATREEVEREAVEYLQGKGRFRKSRR